MQTIPQKELRNNVAAVLRRAESGEVLTVTVSGRAVAELGPIRGRQWIGGSELAKVWRSPVPRGLAQDLAEMPAALSDPYSS